VELEKEIDNILNEEIGEDEEDQINL